jgi:hypothetical protein
MSVSRDEYSDLRNFCSGCTYKYVAASSPARPLSPLLAAAPWGVVVIVIVAAPPLADAAGTPIDAPDDSLEA